MHSPSHSIISGTATPAHIQSRRNANDEATALAGAVREVRPTGAAVAPVASSAPSSPSSPSHDRMSGDLEHIGMQSGGRDFIDFLERLQAAGALQRDDLAPVARFMVANAAVSQAVFALARAHVESGDAEHLRFGWIEMKRTVYRQCITEHDIKRDPLATACLIRSLFTLEQIDLFAAQLCQRAPGRLSPPQWKVYYSLVSALARPMDLDRRLTTPSMRSALPLSQHCLKQASEHVTQAREGQFHQWLKTHWPTMA